MHGCAYTLLFLFIDSGLFSAKGVLCFFLLVCQLCDDLFVSPTRRDHCNTGVECLFLYVIFAFFREDDAYKVIELESQ